MLVQNKICYSKEKISTWYHRYNFKFTGWPFSDTCTIWRFYHQERHLEERWRVCFKSLSWKKRLVMAGEKNMSHVDKKKKALDATRHNYTLTLTHTHTKVTPMRLLASCLKGVLREYSLTPTTFPYQHHLALSQPIRIAINHSWRKQCHPCCGSSAIPLSSHMAFSLNLPPWLTSIPWIQKMSFPHLSPLTFFYLSPLITLNPPLRWKH